MAKIVVFDVEGDSLTPTKFHVMSYSVDNILTSIYDYDDLRRVLAEADVLIGHNIIAWDIPQLERLLEIKVTAELVDTMFLSWYLYPKRVKHGLEDWGVEFGIPKPKIDDWENLTREEYTHRCEEDVKITRKLWAKQRAYLIKLYGSWDKAKDFIRYLSFKADCAREQERSGWVFDVKKALIHLTELEKQRDEKLPELVAAMPKVPIIKKRKRPAEPYKKDGTLSVHGCRWFNLLREHNLDELHEGDVEEVVGWKEANPGSHPQVKKWLFDLGWEPENFKFDRNKETHEVRQIPQIKSAEEDGTLCPSVMQLVAQQPAIALLEGMGIINHRISFFEGMLRNDQGGWLIAGIAGLTNTLRFKHRAPLANIPGVDKPWGKEIRGCLRATNDDYILCGSDQSSLEDRTKLHYMYEYDPDYVDEMSVPGFDPHLDLAKVAGVLTAEDVQAYKDGDKKHSIVRKIYKVANYACVYGAGAPTVARGAKCTVKEAETLVNTYWKRNWAVKAIAADQKTKTVNGQMWLYNPVSKFWYSLRFKKDIFSTLNQGTGVYCFDMWVKEFRKKRPQCTAQFHDEVVLNVLKVHQKRLHKLLRDALDVVNKKLNLNRQLDIDIQFGATYAEIH